MTDSEQRPEQQILHVRLVAHTHQDDPQISRSRSEQIERLSRDRFEDQVDPDHQLKPAERTARARNARRAYYTALAFRSSRARSKRHEDADQ